MNGESLKSFLSRMGKDVSNVEMQLNDLGIEVGDKGLFEVLDELSLRWKK